MSRVLPSRFYTADPADLADELIAARERESRRLADRAIEAAMESAAPAKVTPRRYLDFQSRRERIRALTAEARKKKP